MCKVFFNEACASTFASYIYSPPTKRSKMNCGMSLVDNSVSAPRVEVIKKNQTAQIGKIIIEQNCGFIDFEGEKLFFHGSQMIGNIVSELEVGDVMNFDIVYNPRTSKFLAKNVRRTESVKAKKNLGHFQMMQVSEAQEVSQLEESEGKVTKLCKDYGFINHEIFFHYSSLVGTHMSELQVGSCLSFKAKMNKSNTRKVASNVQKLVVPEIQVSPGLKKLEVKVEVPELNAIKTILALEGANLLRRLSKNLVVNDDVDNSLMQHIKVDSLGGVRKNSLTPTATSLINSRRGSAIGFR